MVSFKNSTSENYSYRDTRKETNSARQEREVEYYKSRIEVLERFNISTKTKILKYIPSSGTWYICGEYADLLKSQSF